MAARYWRLVGLETYAHGDLELSELHLLGSAGRIDASAYLVCTHAPTVGTLAALRDEAVTVCRFAASDVRSPGFAIVWDFGDGNSVSVSWLRLGASDAANTFLADCTLQSSSDGLAWVTERRLGRWIFPGAFAWTDASGGGDPDWDSVGALVPFDEPLGATTFADKSENRLTLTRASAAPMVASAAGFPTGRALRLDGSGSAWVTFPNVPAVRLTSGDFTAEVTLRPDTSSGFRGILGDWLIAGQGNWRFYSSNNTIGFALGNGAGVSTTFVSGQVIRLAIVKKGTRYTLFFNGQPVQTMVNAWLPVQYNNPIVIGTNESYNPVNYVGMVGELRITQVARHETAYEVSTDSFPARGSAALEPAKIRTSTSVPLCAASAAIPTHSTRSTPRLQLARDVEVGGPGTIYGTTKTKATPNIPAKARVVLLRQRSKLPVRETWSDPATGNFAFPHLDTKQQFLTLAEDADGNFRPVAANRLTPEVLP